MEAEGRRLVSPACGAAAKRPTPPLPSRSRAPCCRWCAAARDAAAELGDAPDLSAVAAAAAAGAARRRWPRTTAQLAVLAEAGVVDAGGCGLVVLLEALASVVTGARR